MKSQNSVSLVGQIADDAQCFTTIHGTQIINVPLITITLWQDSNNQKTVQHTEWHHLAIFNDLAEQWINAKLEKGTLVQVKGWLKSKKKVTPEGNLHRLTNIVVEQFDVVSVQKTE